MHYYIRQVIYLLLLLLICILNDIHSDGDEDELSLDRRLWPSSESYNNVFVSENESSDHYYARYGQHLIDSLGQILEKSPTVNIPKTIEKIRDKCNRLIDVQLEAYN
jgi:hypothetical protein